MALKTTSRLTERRLRATIGATIDGDAAAPERSGPVLQQPRVRAL